MGSSYLGIDVFGSGAHRFVVGRQGRRIISLAAIVGSASEAGTAQFGDLELRVEVRGRLVASSEAGLWLVRDALLDQTGLGVNPGVLEDGHGHQWAGMTLLTIEEDGEIARGREISVGYVATFGRLASG